MIDKNQKITVGKDGRVRVRTMNTEKSRTQQQFKDECDINNILKKYVTTGEFTHLTKKNGVYADFSEIRDYRAMVDTVLYAQNAFMALPAEVRKRFDNDPGSLITFLQDPKNVEEATKLGLVEPKKLNDIPLEKNDPETNKTPPTTPPSTPEST